jgi:hypothetical protein
MTSSQNSIEMDFDLRTRTGFRQLWEQLHQNKEEVLSLRRRGSGADGRADRAATFRVFEKSSFVFPTNAAVF